MKKTYETPVAEKVNFKYQEQVTASNTACISRWVNIGLTECVDGNKHLEYVN
ncbi:MAG: hypothetical protein IJO03_08260 [Clostridia bacterium]|nr:hypothetical protein [Clostridia bacterium]MBQ7122235.1 hypothetical protein [Clostridia bacterium]